MNRSGQRLHPPYPPPHPQQPGNAGLRVGTEKAPPTGKSAADPVASLQRTHHHSSFYRGQRLQPPCSISRPLPLCATWTFLDWCGDTLG